MSPGSAPILLLKAAHEPDQLADRLDGGPWTGLEVPLMPAHVADDAAVERAIEHVRAAGAEHVLAEAPVGWPSGAHLRVDRLDDEARAGLGRSARFAAGRAPGWSAARASRRASARPCSPSTSTRPWTPRSTASIAGSTSMPCSRSCASSPTRAGRTASRR